MKDGGDTRPSTARGTLGLRNSTAGYTPESARVDFGEGGYFPFDLAHDGGTKSELAFRRFRTWFVGMKTPWRSRS